MDRLTNGIEKLAARTGARINVGTRMFVFGVSLALMAFIFVTGTSASASPTPAQKTKWEAVTVRLTGYCNEGKRGCTKCNGKWAKYNLTKSGKRPAEGMVAADRKVLPLGSKVKIPKLGEYTVEDTGSAIKGHRLDIFFGSKPGAHQEALEFGTKKVKVLVQRSTKKK